MMDRRLYPEIPIEVELREQAFGLGYVLSVNDNDNLLLFPDPEDNPDPVVEIWVDHATTGGPEDSRPALANIRLTREDAIRLAEQIIIAAERLPITKD